MATSVTLNLQCQWRFLRLHSTLALMVRPMNFARASDKPSSQIDMTPRPSLGSCSPRHHSVLIQHTEWTKKKTNTSSLTIQPVRGAKDKAQPKTKTPLVEPADATTLEVQSEHLMQVCAGANILKGGEDPPIKEDSEYPEWLWTVAEPPKPYDEYSQDSKEYGRRFNKMKARERNTLRKQQRL